MDQNLSPQVEIRASARRRKSGVAFWEAGRVVVVVPERMSRAARDLFAKQLVEHLLKRTGNRHASDAALEARAGLLADLYLDGVRPASIRWSTASSGAGDPARCIRARSASPRACRRSPSGFSTV